MLNYLSLIEHFSYIAIFIVLILNSFILPIPEEIVLLTAGYLASLKVANLYLIMIISVSAMFVGDGIGYYLGKTQGLALVKKIFKWLKIKEKKLEYAENFFKNHGGKTVLLSRFMPGMRIVIPILAGSSKMKYKNFFFWDIIGIILAVLIFVTLGYIYGTEFEAVFNKFKEMKHIIFIGIIIILGILIVIKELKVKKEKA